MRHLSLFARLLRETRGNSRWLILGIVALVGATFAEQAMTILTGRILDWVTHSTTADALTLGCGLLALAGLSLLFSSANTMCFGRYNTRTLHLLRSKTVLSLGEMSFRSRSRFRTGDLLGRVDSDLSQLENGIASLLGNTVRSVLQLSVAIAVAVTVRWQVALAALILPLGYNLLFLRVSRPVERQQREERELFGKVSACFRDDMSGWLEAKTLGLHSRLQVRFESEVKRHVNKSLQISRFWSIISAFDLIMSQGQPILVVVLGAYFIAARMMTLGDLLILLRIAPIFLGFIWDVDPHALRTVNAVVSRIFEVWDQERERRNGGVRSIVERTPLLRVDSIRFAYDVSESSDLLAQRLVLEDVSFSLFEGELVGVIGSSGVGKTTLLRLLCGFYDTFDGHIYFGGRDVRDWSLAALRRNIGLVDQESYLLPGTVYKNIAAGRPPNLPPGLERSSVEGAARLSGLLAQDANSAEVDRMLARDCAVNLSAGERKRIAIARVLLRNPALILLDEPTSDLDAQSESTILRTLLELSNGSAGLVVTHRLGLARSLARLIVLANGRVVEQGSHAALMKERGTYYEMYMRQFPEAK